LSGLLNPRRPPTGNPYGRDGFGSRLPTPYPPPQSPIPGPSTSPFASRLGPAPVGAPYGGRATGAAMPAIQVPPPSGKATTETEPGFFMKRVPVPAYGLVALVAGVFIFGYGIGAVRSKNAPAAPTVIVAKPTAAAPAPVAAAPVVEPVAGSAAQAAAPEPNAAMPPSEATAPKAAVPAPTVTEVAGSGETEKPSDSAPEAGMWKQPAKKPVAPKPHKLAAADTGEDALLKTKPAVATAKPVAPKPAVEKAVKPAAPAAKPAKKSGGKVWVDPFAN
jgi:hypothetical protein